MHRGHIKLWRKMQDSRHFSMGLKHIGMFDLLLVKASYEPEWFKGDQIQPGQCPISVQSLSEQLGESRQTIRRLLNDLVACEMIETENRTHRYTLITICNWQKYQEGAPEPPEMMAPKPKKAPEPQKKKPAKKKQGKVIPPKVEWVAAYCQNRENGIDAQRFVDFYESKGWMVGKQKMKDWQAAIRTWEQKRKEEGKGKQPGASRYPPPPGAKADKQGYWTHPDTGQRMHVRYGAAPERHS